MVKDYLNNRYSSVSESVDTYLCRRRNIILLMGSEPDNRELAGMLDKCNRKTKSLLKKKKVLFRLKRLMNV